ncbi:MAG: hypothetical protein L0Z62_30450, partial [Gemmataceae bacterium]|nr:hypothetical protein [Gemmataceae bacterium]
PAAVVEPLRSDQRLASRRRAQADRLYAAVDRALDELTKQWGITTQAAPAQQDGQSANRN